MRKPSACTVCRARRRKCIYPTQGVDAVCEYCSSHGQQCIQGPPEGGYYARRKARLQSLNSPPQLPQNHDAPPPRHTEPDLPPLALRRELVDLYFDYIHDQFHSMYHRVSFLQDVMHDRVPAIVLLAMFALSARFSTNQAFHGIDPRERGEPYRIRSEELLNIRHLHPTTVQVCLLLGAYAAANGQTDVENIYYSMAGRMCLALDLPSRPVASLIEREVNIRIWWTICMVDVWSSTAVRLPRIMPFDIAVPLPVDEFPFSSMGTDSEHGCIDPTSVSSPLMAEMVKLNRILSKIIDFNRTCVSDHLEGLPLEKGMRELSRDLDVWLENLPQHLRDTPDNFKYFASRGHGRMFVAVYLGYYHYGQLLNYQFLSLSTEASAESGRYADACKQHAARLCSLVYRSQATPGSEVMYPAVSHVLVIASTVQIHTLLFSADEAEIRISKARLERNFEILLRLRAYWPSVDSAMSRLRAFHQTCLRSKETSFVLDRWLLRFLVQFAPHMELEPRDHDPEYEALLALSKQSPLSCYSGLSL
ncbi:hypothetical protein COCC4DRAFT_163610 [Bipolaris maydis ATCC 48331]|uniref:Zn(2)-C6 fungal-type domain-containing protein n=2 Tax=Cochliobolus heterostrophus TaxID=5016 RepID=M2T9C4_COCH5|nr:uncharacterized protein COCC4DRAFT_163610 [Bipolaris maydis ATCC 48331]EMD94150.1 hypothetical protein COCHEDRAFT_1169850 [Bipolaris maydis C5]KAH7564035.1 hypothetical protein BM1_01082 [Bipolaris maydis]ENI07550.1 hypothetical protein COCC4DRAFT_163610 [Bipolaris maydis ATCC 48331]KAJ5026660.1 fungal-specific transcription factor domain-containing protein [Bipolaris maydis]KAJ5059604.1 fungal-specific transcription factor domain-containing protein [Bipolaris maydis]